MKLSIISKAWGIIRKYPQETALIVLLIIITGLSLYARSLSNYIDELEYDNELMNKTLKQNEQAYEDRLAQKDSSIQDLAIVVSDLNSDLERVESERDDIRRAHLAYVSETQFMIDSLRVKTEGITEDGEDELGRYKAFSSDTTEGIVRVASFGRVYIDSDIYRITHDISFLPFSMRMQIYIDDEGIIRHRAEVPDGLTIRVQADIDSESFEHWAMDRVRPAVDDIPTFGLRFSPIVGFMFGSVPASDNQDGNGIRNRLARAMDRLYVDPALEIFYNQWSVGYAPIANMAYVRYNLNLIGW